MGANGAPTNSVSSRRRTPAARGTGAAPDRAGRAHIHRSAVPDLICTQGVIGSNPACLPARIQRDVPLRRVSAFPQYRLGRCPMPESYATARRARGQVGKCKIPLPAPPRTLVRIRDPSGGSNRRRLPSNNSRRLSLIRGLRLSLRYSSSTKSTRIEVAPGICPNRHHGRKRA